MGCGVCVGGGWMGWMVKDGWMDPDTAVSYGTEPKRKN